MFPTNTRLAVLILSVLNFILLPLSTLFIHLLYAFVCTVELLMKFNKITKIRQPKFKETRKGRYIYGTIFTF
jgi:hypothetical protein